MAQQTYHVRYNGPLTSTVLEGHGHFSPGEVKQVDYLTACALKDERCAAEGWEVSDAPFEEEDTENTRAKAREEAQRSTPRTYQRPVADREKATDR